MALELFRYATPITVRFADLDVLQHLNHAVYLTYMEQARINYMGDVCGWRSTERGWDELGIIVARVEIDYQMPITFDDEVLVHVRASRLGNKSFDLEYQVTRQGSNDDTPQNAARAKTIMVVYDYSQQVSAPLSDAWRAAMTKYELGLGA